MYQFSLIVISIIPALSFFLINVFIPGPNVLNTIAISMGSGRGSGISCAIATGLGVFLTSLFALFGAALVFYNFPIIYQALTIIGGALLLYFAKIYIEKSFILYKKIIFQKKINKKNAFKKAFLVLISNPKMMTTWIAVISLFPIVTFNYQNIIIFSLLSALLSFTGHFFFASIFSSQVAINIYFKLYKSINFFVGVGFIFYSLKLFAGLL